MRKALISYSIFSLLVVQSAVAIDLRSTGGSVYAMGGTGRTSDGKSTGNQGGQLGFEKHISGNKSADIIYFNEGTAENVHRDGFAAMVWLKKPITENLSVQAGAGPYLSMNTTTVDGQQKNQNRVGAVAGLAALYRVFGSKFYLTTRITHAEVPDAVDTNTVYVGAGYYYDSATPSNWNSGDTDFSAFVGQSQTTRENSTFAKSFQVEVRRLQTAEVAYSVSIISEGDSGVTDRKGAAAQVWYVIPTKEDNWTFSVGAGPYITHDEREQAGEKTTAMMLGSLDFSRKLTKTVDVMFRWNRGVSFRNKGQDTFYLGIRKHIKN